MTRASLGTTRIPETIFFTPISIFFPPYTSRAVVISSASPPSNQPQALTGSSWTSKIYDTYPGVWRHGDFIAMNPHTKG